MKTVSMLIDGEQVMARSGAIFERRNPLDGEVASCAPAAGVEDAVDELRGFVSGKATRDFERLVDGNRARRRLVKEFINGKAKDVAIHGRHPIDTPMLGARFNAGINLFHMRQRAQGESKRH